MRRLLVVAGLLASMSDAIAGGREVPILRGSEADVPALVACCPRWSGFYFGGQLGYSIGSVDFVHTNEKPIAHMLRNTELQSQHQPSLWTVLGKADASSPSYGAFIGYNFGWEDAVLGVELNYSRTGISTDSPIFPMARIVPVGSNADTVRLTGSASMRITDIVTLRGRAGFDAGNFLPYFTIGAAAGRANIARSTTVDLIQAPLDGSTPARIPFAEAEAKDGAFIFGWSIGGGLDVMVMPNVFLRAEYEYVAFSPVWEIKANVQTVRFGAGLKF